MTHEIAVAAVLTLTLMSGCAAAPGDGGPGGGGIVTGSGATSGGGTGGGDAGGQGGASGNACAEKPPTADPFDCLPTFAEQTQAACAADNGSRQLTAGSCGGLRISSIGAGYYRILCIYDAQGALRWAQRCDDSRVWCGFVCTQSAGSPLALPTDLWLTPDECQLTNMCPGDPGS